MVTIVSLNKRSTIDTRPVTGAHLPCVQNSKSKYLNRNFQSDRSNSRELTVKSLTEFYNYVNYHL